MPRAPHTGDWLALIALTVMWGSAFLLNELALRAFDPLTLVAGRLLIAFVVLYGILRLSGERLPRGSRSWLLLGALAVFGNVLPFNLVAWSQQHISSSLAGVLMAVMPLFVLTLAHFFVPGSRMTGYRVAGFLGGFAGVLVILGPGALTGITGILALLAAAAALAAAFSYAVSTIIARRIPGGAPLQMAAGTALVGSLLTASMAAPQVSALPAPGLVPAAALALLGLFSTGVATILYFRVVHGPGPAFLSLVNYLVPGWAVLLGSLVLGETLDAATIVGLALILAGIAVSEAGPRLAKTVAADRWLPGRSAGRFARNDA